MKKLWLIILLLFPFPMMVMAKNHGRHRGIVRSKYQLSNKVFLKWIPTAMAPNDGASIRFGAEYCFLKEFGFGLETGWVLHSNDHDSKYYLLGGDGGYCICPELKMYVINAYKTRLYTGFMSVYRHEDYSDIAGSAIKDGIKYNYWQTSARKTVLGVAAQIGVVTCIYKNLHLEAASGIGIKNIRFSRDNFTSNLSNDRFRGNELFMGENQILEQQTLPYFFAQIKICWLLGKTVAK